MSETVVEARLKNLLFLIEQYKSIANLNSALGRKRKDATLSQIKNKTKINRTNSTRAMGAALARDIEDKLNLERGWMDKIHEEILPIPDIPEGVIPLSSLKEVHTIPLYEIPFKEVRGQFNPILKGELKLPEITFESLVQDGRDEIAGYISNDRAMIPTIPVGSIVIVDSKVKDYQGDGIYLLLVNDSAKFRRITQLLDGSFQIDSDINKERISTLEQIKILAKAITIYKKQIF